METAKERLLCSDNEAWGAYLGRVSSPGGIGAATRWPVCGLCGLPVGMPVVSTRFEGIEGHAMCVDRFHRLYDKSGH